MYVISFRGLKEGKHQFEYKIDSKFFEVYQYEDILDADVSVRLEFIKKSTLLELDFDVKGKVKLACDVTNELYQQPIDGKYNLTVKFGDEYNDENENILIISHDAYELDISQFIFEIIVLALPTKRIHPGVLDGTLKSDILDKLEELKPKEENNNIDPDPRWDTLKGLLTDKNHKDGTS